MPSGGGSNDASNKSSQPHRDEPKMTEPIGDTEELSLHELAKEARRLAGHAAARTANQDDLVEAMRGLTVEVSNLRRDLQENTPTYLELEQRLDKHDDRYSKRRQLIITYMAITIAISIVGGMWLVDHHRVTCHYPGATDEDTSFWCDLFFPMHDHPVSRERE